MNLINELTTLLSLLIAFISLVISLVALKIARKTFAYSSKDFIPDIKFKILKDESIEVVNNSTELCQIDYVNYIKIRTFGFEDYFSNSIVEIPFVVNSIQYGLIEKIGKIKRFSFNFDSVGPCAYLCRYDEGLVKELQEKISDCYSLDSKRGYALPSLQSLLYIIEVVYSNNLLERNSLIYKQEYMHGLGFDITKINSEMLNRILNKSNIPKFKDPEKLWSYILKRFSIPVEKYFW